MDSHKNLHSRLSLVFLLLLLLIGISGHLLAPTGGSHPILSETTCAIHQSINLPLNIHISWNESGIAIDPAHDDTCVLNIVLKNPHPPKN
jgi:hypothetical protein